MTQVSRATVLSDCRAEQRPQHPAFRRSRPVVGSHGGEQHRGPPHGRSVIRESRSTSLCVLLAIYAFAVFGYVTAAIAAYFVGTDRQARIA